MSETSIEIGRVVRSKAGRDKNGVYIIVEVIDRDYVMIANGADRSIDKPKKKKIKHLEPKPYIAFDIKVKLENGRKVFDGEIKKSLKSLGYELKGG